MIFESLGSKFNKIFKKIKFKSGKIQENDLNEVLSEIRRTLLEADVNVRVAMSVNEKIKQNALGAEIVPGVSAEEMIIKISHDAIKEIFGKDEEHGFKISKDSTERIMLVGLQGSGKTTTAAKLANFINLKTKSNDSSLCSLDFYRPAAIEQLRLLSIKNNLNFFNEKNSSQNHERADEEKKKSVLQTAKNFMEKIQADKIKKSIIDTAGRTSINDEMMDELLDVKNIINPTQIILVIDSMIGKSAIDMAKQFNEKIGLTGLIFTKTESDTKAGAILSVKHILNLPIHFLCSGEKIDDIDEFHVERITQRILGMGDIVSLVEKASDAIGEKDNDALKAKAAKGELDLFDVLEQFKFLKKMGGLPFVSKFLPAEMLNQANISENKVKHFEAIILSMTKKERISPKIVMQSTPRKSRIAKGSGTSEKLVHELLMMHSQISKIAQQFAQFDKSSLIDKFKLGNSLSGLGNFMSPGDKKK